MTRFALGGNGEGAPQFLAVIGIEARDVAAHAELAARATDEHLAVHHERHQREILALLVVLDLGIPEHLAGLGVECDQMVVGGGEIKLVLPQADAAAGRMQLEQIVGKLPLVAPILVARLCVQRDHLPHRRCNEHHAIVDDRRRLVSLDDAGRECPHRGQVLDVRGVDLVERAIAVSIIGPAIQHPVAGFGIFQTRCRDRAVILDRSCNGSGGDEACEPNRSR